MVKSMARSQTGTLKGSWIEVACSWLTAALLPWAPVVVTLTRQKQSPVYSALRLGKNICAARIFCAPMTARRRQGTKEGERITGECARRWSTDRR